MARCEFYVNVITKRLKYKYCSDPKYDIILFYNVLTIYRMLDNLDNLQTRNITAAKLFKG